MADLIRVKPTTYKIVGYPEGWYLLSDIAQMLRLTPKKCWEVYFPIFSSGGGRIAVYSIDFDRLEFVFDRDDIGPEDIENVLISSNKGDAAFESVTVRLVHDGGEYYLMDTSGDYVSKKSNTVTGVVYVDEIEDAMHNLSPSVVELAAFNLGLMVKPSE